MRYLFIIFFCLSVTFGQTQTERPIWEETYGGKSDEFIHQTIEATNGYLIAVGETSSQTEGGTDGLLIITDFSTGQEIAYQQLGGRKDDALHAIVQLFDGHFLLAGATESSGAGKSDGWLIKIDERGEVLWEKTFGGDGPDAFRYALATPDGGVVLAGEKDKQKDGDIWLCKLQEQSLAWESQIGRGHYEAVKGMALAQDQGVVLTGNTANSDKRDRGDIFWIKTDERGQLQDERFFGEKDWEEATGIAAVPGGGFAICGHTRSKGQGESDLWLLRLNEGGFQMWEQTFGERDEDLGYALAHTADDGFIVVGATKSYRSGARSFRAYLVKTDGGGVRQWERDYGGKKGDVASSVTVLHDGTIAAAGHTASRGSGGEDIWITRFPPLDQTFGAAYSGAKETKVEFSEAALSTPDGQLTPNRRAYLAFTLFNTSGGAVDDLQVKVKQRSGSPGIQIWQENYFGPLRAENNREIRIPISTSDQIRSDDNQLEVTIFSGGAALGSFDYTFKTKQPVAADVVFDNFKFGVAQDSDQESVQVVVRNPGDFQATNVQVTFQPPAGIQAVSPASQTIRAIAPLGSHTVTFSFLRSRSFREDRIAIPCTIDFGGRQIRKTLEKGALYGNEVTLIVTEPSGRESILTEKNFYDFTVGIKAASLVREQDIKVVRNNTILDGSKMDEVDLRNLNGATRTAAPTTNGYEYVYKNRVPLIPGENRIEIEVQTPNGNFRTDTKIITFQPRQPNLHVLTIGPTHPDLKYTAKDAADFAAAFKNQAGPGKLFGKVFLRSLTLPEETEAGNIRVAVEELAYQYENKAAAQRILDQDLLLVFVSSHGENDRGFKLLPTDYKPGFQSLTIDFQEDVVDQLERIKCKKVVLIDACHSGAADSKALNDVTRADALTRLAALHPGMNTLTSCGSNEMSYEDDQWENGAFTEAILEAFDNAEAVDQNGPFRADVNSDNLLSMSELYTYLRRRVPSMVQQQKPNAPTNQIPFMPETQMDIREIPIYVIDQSQN